MTTSITTADPLEAGAVVRVWSSLADPAIGPQWMRVVSTAGAGPFTSEVRALSWRERFWLGVRGMVLRLWGRWTDRVWWPLVFWAEDRWAEWRQRARVKRRRR